MAYTTKDVPAGSPLRMSYGDPTNPSVFLATYGFLDETSPSSFCKLMNLEQEMNDLGVDFNRMLFYKDTGDISEEVWDVLLYRVTSRVCPTSTWAWQEARHTTLVHLEQLRPAAHFSICNHIASLVFYTQQSTRAHCEGAVLTLHPDHRIS